MSEDLCAGAITTRLRRLKRAAASCYKSAKIKVQTIEDQFDGTTFDPTSGSTKDTRTGTLDLQALDIKGPLAWEPSEENGAR